MDMYAARQEWRGANGLDYTVGMMRSEREGFVGGGWEWGFWEVVKGMVGEREGVARS